MVVVPLKVSLISIVQKGFPGFLTVPNGDHRKAIQVPSGASAGTFGGGFPYFWKPMGQGLPPKKLSERQFFGCGSSFQVFYSLKQPHGDFLAGKEHHLRARPGLRELPRRQVVLAARLETSGALRASLAAFT